MTFSTDVLRNDERAIYSLRQLYKQFGYTQFKVGRFEEYDLYASNKSFLISENILTFTDTNGKLMALKPDVTLSIIKNISSNEKATQKFYYNENVYRTSATAQGFKEIMQTGLECIGKVDIFAESEVIMLAMRSLESVSEDYVLDVSHMGLIEGLLECTELDIQGKAQMLDYVKSKNLSGIEKMCVERGIDKQTSAKICVLSDLYLPLSKALALIKDSVINEKMSAAYEELVSISEIMSLYGLSDKLYFDFSVVNDFNYYDGVIFKGFIKTIPNSVLSGGRYDKLLVKMGKSLQAIGFAVYLDRLERYGTDESEFDTDVLLVYDSDVESKIVIDTVRKLNESGKSVRTSLVCDKNTRYRQLAKITKGGIEILETND
jgi:ATP phosphoribosyltransferase regulatory subunit